MTAENVPREALEEALIALIPEVEAIGNVTLRSNLLEKGWSEEQYWEIRNLLIERGVLATGRGKGGSVRRVLAPQVAQTPVTQPVESQLATQSQSERDLYQPMAEVIKSKWALDYRLDSIVVEITASQGARQTGGKWTRPDITVASYKTFPYVPGRHFDLFTFEIKPVETIDITVVYEALGHRRAATKAYALMHIPETRRTELEATLEEICLEAKRFGIGIIVAATPNNYDTWEELVEAVRHEPDPERMNDFLAQQVSPNFREQIIRWFR